MLTLFAVPKPFHGHIATIQRNAIGSWMRLHSGCQILIFGEEEGTAETARDFGLRHVPEVSRNEYGTPLLNDLFDKAEQLAIHEVLCYVNSDIILMSDFIRAVDKTSQWRKQFLMVGQCWDVGLADPLDFDQPDWEKYLRDVAWQRCETRGPFAIDYFAFPRGFYEHLPPFAIGRAQFDNWLIWKARTRGVAVVDVTHVVLAVHQRHDYSHVPSGKSWSYEGIEARRNLELAGGWKRHYAIFDATHRLIPTGLRRNLGGDLRLKFRWLIKRWWWRMVDWTCPIRHPIGLRTATLERYKARLTRRR